MAETQKTKKGDFVELVYTGYANNQIFDSNIEEDLKKVDSKAKPAKTVVVIGQGMVVSGLDSALEDKEIGKECEVTLKPKDSFGERKRELVKIIPLKVFTEKNVFPRAGMVLALDNTVVKIAAVSGARVTADFNNPLAGKEVTYKFKIVRIVGEEKEKAEVLFSATLRFVPEFEIKEKVIVKGPNVFEGFVKAFSEKFKELIGKELDFEFKEEKKTEDVAGHAHEEHSQEHSHEHEH